jgi:hypothetical protein
MYHCTGLYNALILGNPNITTVNILHRKHTHKHTPHIHTHAQTPHTYTYTHKHAQTHTNFPNKFSRRAGKLNIWKVFNSRELKAHNFIFSGNTDLFI